MVYGLLSMFSSGDRDNMSRTLLAMSSSPDSCVSMRQSGCLPLLIQLLHGTDDIPPTREVRLRASQALHNIVHSHPDDKRGRREARVLRLLEQLRDYSDSLWEKLERLCAGRGPLLEDSMDRHPGPAMAALMKLSFDEEHRHAMCALGGLHAIAELIRRDHEAHGSQTADQYCTSLRRYAGMALTNLTFGDGTNKALLCSFRSFMKALVSQLHSPSEDLRQVTASVLRNLSWRADGSSKISLREVGAVVALMEAALTAKKESTLKVILSAVWNLSAHCSMNKSDICSVCGALAFICSTLTYKSHSKTLNIIENGGGILRNISSHIAVRDDLRQVLRDHNTLSVLLGQLRSPSLTIVSNACGTLWNLSARCPQDQATLWQLGAVPMLRSLINSKHKMISMGSSAALKNLLQAKPEGVAFNDGKSGIGLPTLQARRQKALEQELDPSLAETCDNIETSPRGSPTTTSGDPMFHSLGHYNNAILSDSRETILSTHSDKTHDRLQQILMNHHNGRDDDLGGELPMNGISHGPNGNSHINSFNKFTNHSGNVSESSLTMNVSAKVNNLGSKYLNVRSKNDHVEEKPIPKYDNYVKENANEDSVIEKIGDDEEEQPTNFSLKYSEDKDELAVSSQDPRRQKTKVVNGKEQILSEESQFYEARSIHDDSIRTFCTEGTPYNFSTSTSLSDLREIDRNGRSSEIICKEKDEEDFDIDIDALSDTDIEITPSKEEKLCSKRKGRTTGTSSDKPVTYCVEGTPVSLSRISSVSSMSSEEINEQIENRMASGIISPSELPDSPSQTVPSSPKRVRHIQSGAPHLQVQKLIHPPADSSTATTTTTASDGSQNHQSISPHTRPSRDPVRSSIPRPHTRSQDPERRKALPSRTSSAGPPQREDTDETEDKIRLEAVIKSGMPSSKKSAATNKAPMVSPVTAPRVASSNRTAILLPPPPPPPPPGLKGMSSAIPIQTPNLQVTVQSLNFLSPTNQKDVGGNWPGNDSVCGYCTEDTPANISHAGSHSDLSQLSIPGTSSNGKGSSSHNESLRSEESIEGKRLLEKCIRSGMPKSKVSQPRSKDSCAKDRPLLSPRRSPHQQPLPVARVSPAVKVGVVSPQVNYQKSIATTSVFPTEDVRTYAVEGTPVEFSPAVSLSDLTVDTPPHLSAGKVYKSSVPRGINDKGLGFTGSYTSQEIPQRYGVENTPSNLSRRSSLSSGMESIGKNRLENPKIYGVEGTPIMYSHNSSLSSLSVESETTTPREEALLRKCINQGMPRGSPSRIPQVSGRGVSSRLIPGIPMDHLHLNQFTNSSSPNMAASDAESKKLFSESEESEKQSPRKWNSLGTLESHETSTEEEKTNEECLRTDVQNCEQGYPSTSEEKKNSSPEESKNMMEKSSPSSGSLELRSDTSISESNVVLVEALKVAKEVSKDSGRQASSDEVSLMSASAASISSACIDLIKPPSAMGSLLSLSTSSVDEGKTCKQAVIKKMECRHTKRLPEMVRRALGDQDCLNHQGSDGASLASSCHSNIDNIFPPSLVDDDMESSMISVASITSEVVDLTKVSPPSTGMSIASEALSGIAAPAKQIVSLLQREAQGATSSLTLTAGDEASTYQEITDLEETLGPQQADDIPSDTEVAIDDLPQDIP
ncbi:Adenomatous polyposis coli protein [Armadillidium nasatum]|uniref:Adenomatous polyposis coli protein n=1 Tax=Armadillidium nasatum TaxID=96803 RepID=A0A5N5TPS0_9CRUS|nr:Adenomatous polyposis coli protein [Armadillidium nasatum]